jgi:hypothetical protein
LIFKGLHDVISQKVELLPATAVRAFSPDNQCAGRDSKCIPSELKSEGKERMNDVEEKCHILFWGYISSFVTRDFIKSRKTSGCPGWELILDLGASRL